MAIEQANGPRSMRRDQATTWDAAEVESRLTDVVSDATDLRSRQ